MSGHKLKPFQEVGRDFLSERAQALLADQMRLGKSVQAITASDKINAARVLVVCPSVARPVWVQEFEKWSDRPTVSTLGGTSICKSFVLEYQTEHDDIVLIVSYDEARLYRDALKRRFWDLLILDEIHYAKNTRAQRTGAVLSKNGLAWRARRLWALSGTPAPNHAGELWPLLRVCGRVKVDQWQFENYFCRVDDTGKVLGTTRDKRKLKELRGILKGFMLRRRTSQVAPELDKLDIHPYPVESSTRFLEAARPVDCEKLETQARQQEQELIAALAELPPDEHAQYLQEHSESYTAMRRVHGLLKTPAIYETIKFELEQDLVDKIVVFGYYRESLMTLYRLLKDDGFRPTLMFGGTPERKKVIGLERFNDESKKGGRVFIGQLIACGVAIDLSVACEGIMLEKDWIPGNNHQAMERMGGHNQKRPVRFRDAILPGPVDGYLNTVLNTKARELASIFDEGEND